MKPLRAVTLTGTADAIAKATVANMADTIRKYCVDIMIMADLDNLAIVVESFRSIRMKGTNINMFGRFYHLHSKPLARLDPADAVNIANRLSIIAKAGRDIPVLYACSAGVTVLSIPRLSLIRGGAA